MSKNTKTGHAKRWTPWSVSSVVNRELNAWRSSNASRRKLALSKVERELLFAGEHPIRLSISLFFLFALLDVFARVIPSDILTVPWRAWGASEQLTYFASLWTVQATLSALVYPIVIAFITVFLQRRPASKALLQLYILDSCALAAGLSSVALVLAMALQYLLIPSYGSSILPGWVALDAAWFVVNAALTGYFLFRTMRFLRADAQDEAILRYSIGIALPRDLARIYPRYVLTQGITDGWIPGLWNSTAESPDGEPKAVLQRFSLDEAQISEFLTLSRPSRLVDVRLVFLRIAIRLWVRSERKRARKSNDPKRKQPVLYLPPAIGFEYSDSIPLARIHDGERLSFFTAFLIRNTFVFRPVGQEHIAIEVKAILKELEMDAASEASRGNVDGFRTAYASLLKLHQALLAATVTKDAEGSANSWALLTAPPAYFTFPIYMEWNKQYVSIVKAAVSNITSEIEPVRNLCYIAIELSGDALEQSPLEIRTAALRLPAVVMHHLGKWWIQKMGEQGIVATDSTTALRLGVPFGEMYEDIVSTFVGAWENTRKMATGGTEFSPKKHWGSGYDFALLQYEHLQQTAQMLLSAVARNDLTASEWLADVLVKWPGDTRAARSSILLIGKTEFLTIEHLKLPWPDIIEVLGISAEDLDLFRIETSVLQRDVVHAAVANLWVDVVLIVIEMLLSAIPGSAQQDDAPSTATVIAFGLLTSKQWRRGGTASSLIESMTADNYVAYKLRQFAADGNRGSGYLGRLDELVRQVKTLRGPSMISSRSYVSWGADDVSSLGNQQFAVLYYLSKSEWLTSTALKRQINIWLSHYPKCFDAARDALSDWSRRADSAETPATEIALRLAAVSNTIFDVADAKQHAKRALSDLSTFLDDQLHARLAQQPVDPQRVLQLEQFASSQGFSKATANFPVHLFTDVTIEDAVLEEFNLRFVGETKDSLVQTGHEARPIGEREYWANTLANYVGVIVLGDVLRQGHIRRATAPDESSYWEVLKIEASRLSDLGMHPLLIVSNATEPDWLWRWQNADYGLPDYSKPSDMNVHRLVGAGNGYVCNLGDIQVFQSQGVRSGRSVMIPRELLQRVTFQRFANDLCVAIEVTPQAEDGYLVDLSLRFGRALQLSDVDIVEILHSDASSGDHASETQAD